MNPGTDATPQPDTYVRRPIDMDKATPKCDIPGCPECAAFASLYEGVAAAVEAWQHLIVARERAVAVMRDAYDAQVKGDPEPTLQAHFDLFLDVAVTATETDQGFLRMAQFVGHFADDHPSCGKPLDAEIAAFRALGRRASIANITMHGIRPELAAAAFDVVARKTGLDPRDVPYIDPSSVQVMTPEQAVNRSPRNAVDFTEILREIIKKTDESDTDGPVPFVVPRTPGNSTDRDGSGSGGHE